MGFFVTLNLGLLGKRKKGKMKEKMKEKEEIICVTNYMGGISYASFVGLPNGILSAFWIFTG